MIMKTYYDIYNIENEDAIFVKSVTTETSAKLYCFQRNRNGKRNYMYLKHQE